MQKLRSALSRSCCCAPSPLGPDIHWTAANWWSRSKGLRNFVPLRSQACPQAYILRRLEHGESWEDSEDACHGKDIEREKPQAKVHPFPPLPPPCLDTSPFHKDGGSIGKGAQTAVPGASMHLGLLDGTSRARSRIVVALVREVSPCSLECLWEFRGPLKSSWTKPLQQATRGTLLRDCQKASSKPLLANSSPHEIGAKTMRFWVLRARELDADVATTDEIARGFNLGGPIPSCPEFKVKGTTVMGTSAAQARKAIINAAKGSGNEKIDLETFEATINEVERGWLDGPLDHSALGAISLVTRRFGVVQGTKARPIDNYLECGVNSTASVSDTISVRALDCISAGLAYRLDKDRESRGQGLVMKTYDLSKAYKHLPLSQEALADSFLSVFDPHTRAPKLFRQKVLPFGSRHSVHSFCRTSLGLWKIAVVVFAVQLNVYFDDFVGAEVPPLARLFDVSMQLLLKVGPCERKRRNLRIPC